MKRFFTEEDGQTLVEYGLLVSLIALVVIAVLTTLGKKVQTVFNVANNALTTLFASPYASRRSVTRHLFQ
jgi:pilus assembly protein Flp/PilA